MSGEQMKLSTAQLPDREHSDDKVFATANAVVVLDGASAFRPIQVPASTYAERLGKHIHDLLASTPEADLRKVLREAIANTVDDLGLRAGHSPSSTVAMARLNGDQVDALVLGDTPIVLPSGVFVDERLDALDLKPRRQYRERLAAGSGYDEEHRRTLQELQNQQVTRRNREGGYWIAEADPDAALHAVTAEYRVEDAPWAVLATDGAFNTIEHLALNDWPKIVRCNRTQLADLLQQCHNWEAEHDPDGREFPRSKRHDDKAIATVQWTR